MISYNVILTIQELKDEVESGIHADIKFYRVPHCFLLPILSALEWCGIAGTVLDAGGILWSELSKDLDSLKSWPAKRS